MHLARSVRGAARIKQACPPARPRAAVAVGYGGEGLDPGAIERTADQTDGRGIVNRAQGRSTARTECARGIIGRPPKCRHAARSVPNDRISGITDPDESGRTRMALAHMTGTTVRMLRRASCHEPNMPTQTPASQLHYATPDLRQWSFDMWPDQSHRKSLAKKKRPPCGAALSRSISLKSGDDLRHAF